MNAIEICGLTKRYGAKTAVDNLSLIVREGELFSLLGVNGAGKTTTIRMLCCLTPPTEGEAYLLGDSIRTAPQAVKSKINVSPQETAVARELTVCENLELMAGIYGFSNAESKRRAADKIKKLGLSEVFSARAKTLSGGMQRRLSIAMALISEPRVLFLDEPTLGLDVLARRDLWNVIGELKGRITVILTTHYLEEAEALSDHIGILSRGKLHAMGTAQELIAQAGSANFEDAFVKLATEPEVTK